MVKILEGTIYAQIGALEGLVQSISDQARNDSPNTKIILEKLSNVILQVEMLWANKGKLLPEHDLKNELKKNLMDFRDIVKAVIEDIKSEQAISRGSKRSLKSLMKEVENAKEIVDKFPKEWVEESVENQIKAIEAWALEVNTETQKNSPNMDNILQKLKQINVQGRKLEWRGKGLKDLPKEDLTKQLKQKVTEIRAAAMTAFGDIKSEKKISLATRKNLNVLTAQTVKAKELVGKLKEEEQVEREAIGTESEEKAERVLMHRNLPTAAEHKAQLEAARLKEAAYVAKESPQLIAAWNSKQGNAPEWKNATPRFDILLQLEPGKHHLFVVAPAFADLGSYGTNGWERVNEWFNVSGEGTTIELLALAETDDPFVDYPTKKKGSILLKD